MKRLFAAVFLVGLLALSGCGQKQEASGVNLRMVFVPASEKAQSNEFASLLRIVEQITGYTITCVDVTDYNAAVEAMRAGAADFIDKTPEVLQSLPEITERACTASRTPIPRKVRGFPLWSMRPVT